MVTYYGTTLVQLRIKNYVKFTYRFQLNYSERESGGPCISVYFQDVKTPLSLPVEKCIDSALNALKSSGTESYYR